MLEFDDNDKDFEAEISKIELRYLLFNIILSKVAK